MGKSSLKKAATLISPGRCNVGIFHCSLEFYSHYYFGPWQATVLGEASRPRLAFAQWGKMLSTIAKLKTFQSSLRPNGNTAKPKTLVTIWTTDCKNWQPDGKHHLSMKVTKTLLLWTSTLWTTLRWIREEQRTMFCEESEHRIQLCTLKMGFCTTRWGEVEACMQICLHHWEQKG